MTRRCPSSSFPNSGPAMTQTFSFVLASRYAFPISVCHSSSSFSSERKTNPNPNPNCGGLRQMSSSYRSTLVPAITIMFNSIYKMDGNLLVYPSGVIAMERCLRSSNVSYSTSWSFSAFSESAHLVFLFS
jgi:hypothetical protein